MIALAAVGLGYLAFCLSEGQHRTPAGPLDRRDERHEVRLQRVASKTPILRDETVRRIALFRQQPNAHHRLLLNEVIAVYYRANPAECVAVLNELRAAAFLQSAYPPIIYAQGGSIESAFQLASQLQSGATADAIVTIAFRGELETDPVKAFELLLQLPAHLRFELSREVAKSWGRRDGPAAANAFYRAFEQAPAEGAQLTWPFTDALVAWASQGDPNVPLSFLNDLQAEGKSLIPILKNEYLRTLSNVQPSLMAKLSTSIIPSRTESSSRMTALWQLGRAAPDKALAQVEAMTEPEMKVRGLLIIANEQSSVDTQRTQTILERLPPSTQSSDVMRKLSSTIAVKDSAEAIAFVQRQQDPYLRKAALEGVAASVDQSTEPTQIDRLLGSAVQANTSDVLTAIADRLLARYAASGTDASVIRPETDVPEATKAALLARLRQQYPPEKLRQLSEAMKR